jgi:hypothetical protein
VAAASQPFLPTRGAPRPEPCRRRAPGDGGQSDPGRARLAVGPGLALAGDSAALRPCRRPARQARAVSSTCHGSGAMVRRVRVHRTCPRSC